MGKESIKIARKFAAKIRKNIPTEKIILFGSRARGDNLNKSDYDFVIVSRYFDKKPFIFRASECYDYWDEDVDIEPICYTPEEFQRKKKEIGIVKRAIKEGIEI